MDTGMNTARADATPPPATTAPAPLKPPAPLFAAALEAVELELTLGLKEAEEDELEAVIRDTVESVGGVLLFQMKLGEAGTGRQVAAVAFGEAGQREIAVIDLPCAGGRATVSPAAGSDLPIAAIASAYAGLAECWTKAA